MKKRPGFTPIEIIIAIVVVGLIGGGIWYAVRGGKPKESATPLPTVSSEPKVADSVDWAWSETAWVPTANPAGSIIPQCDSPVKFSNAPSDLAKATSVLYPGQTRGGDYKPHGGFRFDGSKNDAIAVKAIMDGRVTSGARYLEVGEIQYMFTITNDCGIAYRYDHLLSLSPEFQKLADTLPAAKKDDSRMTNFENPVAVKAGDIIATAVGHKVNNNISYDLGVYDYRTRNKAASNPAYVATHKAKAAQAYYAVCWFEMFPAADAARIKSLPAGDAKMGKSSDYCL
ncbi:MAG: hypothetical protein U0526_04310 [Candidatus Saccharibacteria bacterium]